MANKYVSLPNLSRFLTKIQTLFATKDEVDETFLKKNESNTVSGFSIHTMLGNRIPTEAINISPSGIKFTGSLTGTATSATKATQDADGNVISETYAKKTDVSTAFDSDGKLSFPSGSKLWIE